MCALGWKSLGVLEPPRSPASRRSIGSRLSRKSMRCWSPREPVVSVLLDPAAPGSPTSCRRCGAEAVYAGTSGESDRGDSPTSEARPTTSEPLTGRDEALGLVELLGVSAPGARGRAGRAPRRPSRVRAAGLSVPACAIDDQASRDTSRRRRRRSRLRGTLEAVHPQPEAVDRPDARSLGERTVARRQSGIKTTL